MFALLDLVWLLLVAVAGLYWWHAQGCKQRAWHFARQHCEKMELQLLDDSVVLSRLKLSRNSAGTVQLQRTYLFEFSSTYDDRNRGSIVLLGVNLQSIELGVYRI